MRVVSDQTHTVGLAGAAGPAVLPIPLNLPDRGKVEVTAWTGGVAPPVNAYLLAGWVSLGQAQAQLANDTVGQIDCLMAISQSPCCVGADVLDLRSLTVFFDAANGSGKVMPVTVRVTVYDD